MSDMTFNDVWSIEVCDNATVFLRYRGVDIVALWTGMGNQPKGMASLNVLDGYQLNAAIKDAKTDREFWSEWGMSEQTDINLSGLTELIDKMLDAFTRYNAGDAYRDYMRLGDYEAAAKAIAPYLMEVEGEE